MWDEWEVMSLSVSITLKRSREKPEKYLLEKLELKCNLILCY